jgi:hypothetical protein
VFLAGAVHVQGPGGQAAPAHRYLPDARPGHELGSQRLRHRPVCEVGRGLGPVRTSPAAGPAQHAGLKVPVWPRGDGVGCGPPVPAEIVVRPGYSTPRLAERQRWEGRRIARWVGGVTLQPRNGEVLVHAVIVWFEVVVGKRPVVRDAVERADAEVRREEARPLAAVEDRAPAHRVVHQGDHLRPRLVYRIVGRPTAHVGARVPLLEGGDLPVRLRPPVGRRIRPLTLLQTNHRNPHLRESLGRHRTGGTSAHDDDVSPFPHRASRRACRAYRPARS